MAAIKQEMKLGLIVENPKEMAAIKQEMKLGLIVENPEH
jgi:hypothetical protein